MISGSPAIWAEHSMLSGDVMSAFYMTFVYDHCILNYTKLMPLFSARDIKYIFFLFFELLDKTKKLVHS